MDFTTTDLLTYVVWTVNGSVLSAEYDEKYDFNDDGIFSYPDVQTVLEYTVENIDSFEHMENADFPVSEYALNRTDDDPDPCRYCKYGLVCGKNTEEGGF